MKEYICKIASLDEIETKWNFEISNHKNNEDVEYTLFDELIEEFFNDEYDEETEYEYDSMILENQKPVLSFEDFLFETN